jgi:hypothetical protein
MALSDREKEVRKRLRDDYAHYAARCLRIRTKAGAVKAFQLNEAQRYIHECLEQQRAETGKIRALVLKGRQQGCSTYVEGRFYWKVTHRKGTRAFILTHMDEATNNLFGMAKRYHENCPELVKPSTRASNAKELIFDRLDSGYKVGTAGSTGTGRGDTIQLFHGSEVAYWPHAETHVAGALQAVPNEPDTEVILESTSAGPLGLFYEMCKAAQDGHGEYILIFVPWFWQSEYRLNPKPGFEMTSEEREYAEAHGLDLAQIAWRRAKIVELRGIENFRREYPATVEEAFMADAKGALWKRDIINAGRVNQAPDLVRVVVAIDPSVTNTDKSDEAGVVAAGLGVDGRAYVLEDLSLKASPNGWASVGVNAYHKLNADRIVGEVNNGGDMVETVVRTVDPRVSYKKVHASRGKHTRAEPIAALYEQGKVSHVGFNLVSLENQMCTWVPGAKSPDRMDALVWALTELMLELEAPPDEVVEYYDPVAIGPDY